MMTSRRIWAKSIDLVPAPYRKGDQICNQVGKSPDRAPQVVTQPSARILPFRAARPAVTNYDLRDAVAKTTAYVSTLPTTSTVVPLRAVEGAGR